MILAIWGESAQDMLSLSPWSGYFLKKLSDKLQNTAQSFSLYVSVIFHLFALQFNLKLQ